MKSSKDQIKPIDLGESQIPSAKVRQALGYKEFFIGTGVFLVILTLFLRPIKQNWHFSGEYSYYYLLNFGISETIFIKVLLLILSLLSLYFIYLSMKNLKLDSELSFVLCILYAVSVPFLYVLGNFTPHTLIFFTCSLIFYFLSLKTTWSQIVVYLLLIISCFFGIYSIAPVIFVLTYSFTRKEKRLTSSIVSILVLIGSYFLSFGVSFNVPSSHLQHLVADFGSIHGIGVTVWLMALFGILMTWKAKEKFIYVYVSTFILFVLSLNYLFFLIYLNIFILIFASFFYRYIFFRKWDLQFCGTIIQIVIVCSLLFTGAYYANRNSLMEPTNEMLESFEFLKGEDRGVVLSHPQNGVFIKYFTGNEVLASLRRPSDDLLDLLYGENIRETLAALKENNIDYIWLDTEMKEGQVWTDHGQGLLGLLQSKTYFSLIYQKDGIEIWKVK